MFSDIHTHILYGTDDGAKTFDDTKAMIKFAYDEGTRLICLTPHFFPAFFGDNHEQSEEAFSVLKCFCEKHYPDLELVLGNELGYKHDSIIWLQGGLCRPMGDTNYLLVEFLVDDSEDQIAEGVYRLQNAGYAPIIAHAERYKKLTFDRIWSFRENGVLIQINADSVLKTKGLFGDKRTKKLIKKGYVDFVSSDAHNIERRPPRMKDSYEFFAKEYGEEYAKKVYRKNAMNLFLKKDEKDGK